MKMKAVGKRAIIRSESENSCRHEEEDEARKWEKSMVNEAVIELRRLS